MVQPHQKDDKQSKPAARERAIHDLVLIKAITQQDNPADCTTKPKDLSPSEVHLLTSIMSPVDTGLFQNDLEERPPSNQQYADCTIQRPEQLIAPLQENEVAFLQTTASSIINKIGKSSVNFIHLP